MVNITGDNIPGGGSRPTWCTKIVESHVVQTPRGGKNSFYIRNTFEGDCSKLTRFGLWMVVIGCGFLPLLIPNVCRGAIKGKWQITTDPVGTNDIKEVAKVITITSNDPLSKYHLFINDIRDKTSKSKEFSIDELNSYLPRLGEVQQNCRCFPDIQSTASLFVEQIHLHAKTDKVLFEKGSACERFFINSASEDSLKAYILKLKKEKGIDEAHTFVGACLRRFSHTKLSGSAFSVHNETFINEDFKHWLEENGLLTPSIVQCIMKRQIP